MGGGWIQFVYLDHILHTFQEICFTQYIEPLLCFFHCWVHHFSMIDSQTINHLLCITISTPCIYKLNWLLFLIILNIHWFQFYFWICNRIQSTKIIALNRIDNNLSFSIKSQNKLVIVLKLQTMYPLRNLWLVKLYLDNSKNMPNLPFTFFSIIIMFNMWNFALGIIHI